MNENRDSLSDREGSEHLVHPLLQAARGYLTDEDYVAVEATLQEAVERAKDLELLVFWCPDAEVCKTCQCAGEDDVCFPGEKLRAEASRLRADLEALKADREWCPCMPELDRLRAEVERLKASEGWEDELNAAWAIVNQARAENEGLRESLGHAVVMAASDQAQHEELLRLRAAVEGLREAISKAPHPLHCAASSPMWPGPCSCWKSRASFDEILASEEGNHG